jgi:hypothetical protein
MSISASFSNGARVRISPGPADRRFNQDNPNHHLWRNGRLWWIAYTVIHDGWRQERIRHSLRTADLAEARRRRDTILARVSRLGSSTPDREPCRLSA